MFAPVKKIAHKQIRGTECNLAGLSEAQSEKVQKVAIIIRAIFIIVVRYLENKCGLSVWDGYIL